MRSTAIALALSLLASTAPAGAECIQSPELRVIDGDTVEMLPDGPTVRMVGYNTAESGDDAQCDQERDLSAAATARLEGLLDEHEAILCLTGTTCGYGRACGHLNVIDRYTLNVGAILIEEGLARPFTGRRGSWCD